MIRMTMISIIIGISCLIGSVVILVKSDEKSMLVLGMAAIFWLLGCLFIGKEERKL